ncbi:MAG TPA: DUF2783 domain-containing protein [Thiolinea sp.]|nr:DUF2783 domain-containing protein [Thiolinea sp.]
MMTDKLILEPNFSDADAFFAALAEAHREGEDAVSEKVNARLILLLANHIGDQNILQQALAIAAQEEPQHE